MMNRRILNSLFFAYAMIAASEAFLTNRIPNTADSYNSPATMGSTGTDLLTLIKMNSAAMSSRVPNLVSSIDERDRQRVDENLWQGPPTSRIELDLRNILSSHDKKIANADGFLVPVINDAQNFNSPVMYPDPDFNSKMIDPVQRSYPPKVVYDGKIFTSQNMYSSQSFDSSGMYYESMKPIDRVPEIMGPKMFNPAEISNDYQNPFSPAMLDDPDQSLNSLMYSDPSMNTPKMYPDLNMNSPIIYPDPSMDSPQMYPDLNMNSPIIYPDPSMDSPQMYPDLNMNSPIIYPDPSINSPQMYPDLNMNSPIIYLDPSINSPQMYPDPSMNTTMSYLDPIMNSPKMYPEESFNFPKMYPEESFNSPKMYPDQSFNSPKMYPESLKPVDSVPDIMGLEMMNHAEVSNDYQSPFSSAIQDNPSNISPGMSHEAGSYNSPNSIANDPTFHAPIIMNSEQPRQLPPVKIDIPSSVKKLRKLPPPKMIEKKNDLVVDPVKIDTSSPVKKL